MNPTKKVSATIGGVVAKATHKYRGVKLHDLKFTSNHFHLLISATHPEQISKFVGWLSREISVRVGRLIGWRGAFYERRFDAPVVLDDDAIIGRVKYIRAHGVKEGLVDNPDDWPGLSLTPEIDHGICREFKFESKTTGAIETLPILWSPLPHLKKLDEQEQRSQMRKMGMVAAEEARKVREGKPSLGIDKILKQDPQSRPKNVKRTPRIFCFASNPDTIQQYWETYKDFVQRLQESYDNLLVAWRRIGHKAFCLPGFGMCLEST